MDSSRRGAAQFQVKTVATKEVRRWLTPAEDIRGDVTFQNDVNSLLASLERNELAWRSLAENLSNAP